MTVDKAIARAGKRQRTLTAKARKRRARRWLERLYAWHGGRFVRRPGARPWKVHHDGRLR
jgi:hypothetical protein